MNLRFVARLRDHADVVVPDEVICPAPQEPVPADVLLDAMELVCLEHGEACYCDVCLAIRDGSMYAMARAIIALYREAP